MNPTSELGSPGQSTDRNRLLNALPERVRARLADHLELVDVEAGSVLAQPDRPSTHIWFPETATMTITSAPASRAVEVGTVGHEGMASLAGFLGADVEPLRITCLVPGAMWRLPVQSLGKAGAADGELEAVLRRYALVSFLQAAQAAACCGLHSLEQRCAKWMLVVQDSVGDKPFPLTHQQLATSLGVRRAGATVAMRALRDAGAVEYTRGRISIMNRAPLEARACECYGITRSQYDRLLQPAATAIA